ncbi:MAG TPA: L-seryl-tRNA(Sec) selenium transferase [Terriglobales bacterium]|nr:L-seryl-tRNA(Sec) selenium transferase [Terriglobales bacterium]
MQDTRAELYRKLPSVDELLRTPALKSSVEREGQSAVTDAARNVLARLREEIATGTLEEKTIEIALAGLADAVERQLRQALSYSLRCAINATGVILHTNLGRAPISKAALEHVMEVATVYSNLEFDIQTGERGKRDVHVDRLFQRLFEGVLPAGRSSVTTNLSTVVVNNNAAAVLIALNTLAEGGEVIVSRGELVEIGGSFRIPDVMAKSGAVLREVGTTNRTRIADYERAINDKTRLLLRVHRSNFQITGFTEQPTMSQLSELAQRRGIPLMEDLGSGALFDLRAVGIQGEPGVLDSLVAGVSIVTYSGDKLLGGPQAGLISGQRELVGRIRGNPLFRALRVDKLTYAALEGTLLAYVKQDHDAVPALRMMRATKQSIADRAENLIQRMQGNSLRHELIQGESVIGGGAAPSACLPTRLLAITSDRHTAHELSAKLRACDPPIIARVEDGRVLLDLRTVFPEQDQVIAAALNSIGSGC